MFPQSSKTFLPATDFSSTQSPANARHPSTMESQTWDLRSVYSVVPQPEKLLNVVSLSCNRYTLCVDGEHFEANATSTITTPLHGPLRAPSESSSSSDSGSTTEIFNPRGLLAPIPAAQVDVASRHSILGEKRKRDQGKLRDVDAVDGDKCEKPSILCVQMKLTLQQRSPNCDSRP